MSLSAILGSALSGLQASQIGIRASSNNVSNVNTPGYARVEAGLSTRVVNGVGFGVSVTGVVRVADAFLQAASIRATAVASESDIVAAALDRFQAQVGTFDDQGSIFSRLNQAFTSIGSAAVDPGLSVSRLSVAADLQSFFKEGRRLYNELRIQRQEADSRIGSTIERVNELTAEIAALNLEVQSLSAAAADSTGAQNRQAELIDELGKFVDVRTSTQPDGRIFVTTTDGVGLVENGSAILRYPPSGSGAAGVDYARITIQPPGGTVQRDFNAHISGGELAGLIRLRDDELPALMEEIAELVSSAADALNKAHNDATAYPPPTTLTGHNTGLLGTDALNFTGATTIAVTGNSGALVKRIDVDFDAGTYSVDGGAAVAFGGTSVDDFITSLNTALGADGSASFTNGVMSISATGTNGIATLQDATTPSDRAGRGFSHFFGLNDLVDSIRPVHFATGLQTTDSHGYTAGQELIFSVTAPNGSDVGDITIGVTGATMGDMLTALNDPTTGLGRYVTFSLDANGRLVQTPVAGFQDFGVELKADNTERGTTGISFSSQFGLGLAAKVTRLDAMNVAERIRADSSLLSLAKLDLDGAPAIGDIVVAAGDGRGGHALQGVMTAQRSFDAAGGFTASTATLEAFASRIAGDIGSRAARAERAMQSAQSLKAAADQKRADVEGVSLDEELANMTLFQQSYNASARLLQTAKELTETLINLI
ncbi:flagellar hook-associated protein FlgK [Hyphobacterium sp. HN65]|uniref:Flagellar hook-associated protein 1 n=1 Tax=Hyphobacterium lacteum TaxID=3116575 RepID=A0ABU7LQD2_9PROT|nr:flagellar hook-associated protein FlgK [Hyphobacterium sp. HN65]MEE2526117.1 flagellar hook-associated protein FlgK [Hyphobacterium sp. HN65]